MVDMFTDDATYIDPAWGRYQGRENITGSCATACRA